MAPPVAELPLLSTLRARAGKLHQLTMGAAFALLILASLGAGYAISIAVQREQDVSQSGPAAGADAPPPLASPARTTISASRNLSVPGSDGSSGDLEVVRSGPLLGSKLQYTVQVGSAPDRQTAEQLWLRISNAHADLFAGSEPDIRRVRVADGVDHWVQTGTFGEIALARSLCQKIRARSLNCQVVKK